MFLTPFAMGVVIPWSLPPPTVARRLEIFCNSQVRNQSSACISAHLIYFGIVLVPVCYILLDLCTRLCIAQHTTDVNSLIDTSLLVCGKARHCTDGLKLPSTPIEVIDCLCTHNMVSCRRLDWM